MAEHLIIKGETKAELYATLLPQLQSLVEGESDIIATWQIFQHASWIPFISGG